MVIKLSSRRFRNVIICHNLRVVPFLARYSIQHLTGRVIGVVLIVFQVACSRRSDTGEGREMERRKRAVEKEEGVRSEAIGQVARSFIARNQSHVARNECV